MCRVRVVSILAGVALLSNSGFPARLFAKNRKIVFVAGPKDHGTPGRHEYAKDLAALKYCLDHSPNVSGISTVSYTGQIPAIDEIKDAAVIVIESSGVRRARETHAIFPQDKTSDHSTYDPEALARLAQFDKLMQRGVGLVVFHYSTWLDNAVARKYFLDWVGGYYEDGYSKVIETTWSMQPQNKTHPILRGVRPWTMEEEVFAYERLPEDSRRIPLLIASPKEGKPTLASWAVQRKGGGRGFVLTGLDWHRNLALEDDRRLMLNGIVWAARMNVPAGGVASTLPPDFQ